MEVIRRAGVDLGGDWGNFCVRATAIILCMTIISCDRAASLTEQEAKTALDLKIQPVQPRYSLTSDRFFEIKLSFVNTLAKPIRINSALNYFETEATLIYQISDSAGHAPKRRIQIPRRPPMSKKDFPEIDAKGSMAISQDLRSEFQFDGPARYTLSAIYENRDDGEAHGLKNVWTGKIQSESIMFEVIE